MDAIPRQRKKTDGAAAGGVDESRPHDGDGDCAVDEPRGSQGGGGGGARVASDCAGSGRDCWSDARPWAVDLCGRGIEREDGGLGCGGMSADVWDFEKTNDCADRWW